MAIHLTNGMYYIAHDKTGAIIKVKKIEEAQDFYSVERAIKQTQKSPGKCRGYYFVDTTQVYPNNIMKKRNRKHYSIDTRKVIYDKAGEKCDLCGRKVLFVDMTLDHIVPLAMNGKDDVKNLQCTCRICNQLKGSILPDDFMERITTIFIYQMERKYSSRLIWKIVYIGLDKLL